MLVAHDQHLSFRCGGTARHFMDPSQNLSAEVNKSLMLKKLFLASAGRNSPFATLTITLEQLAPLSLSPSLGSSSSSLSGGSDALSLPGSGPTSYNSSTSTTTATAATIATTATAIYCSWNVLQAVLQCECSDTSMLWWSQVCLKPFSFGGTRKTVFFLWPLAFATACIH